MSLNERDAKTKSFLDRGLHVLTGGNHQTSGASPEARIVFMDTKPFLVARFRAAVQPVLWQVSLDHGSALTLMIENAGPEYALILKSPQDGEMARARFASQNAVSAAHAAVSAALIKTASNVSTKAAVRRRTIELLCFFFALLYFLVAISDHATKDDADKVAASQPDKVASSPATTDKNQADDKDPAKGRVGFIPESALPDTMKGTAAIEKVTPKNGEPAPADNVLTMPPNE